MFTLLFSRVLGRYKGAIAAAFGIIFYTLLVGANAAVLRAILLGMLALLCVQIGQQQLNLNSQSSIAALTAFITFTEKTGLLIPETMDALKDYDLLCTDQTGWIGLTTDGVQMWVEVERK